MYRSTCAKKQALAEKAALETCVAEQNHALAWLAEELAVAASTETELVGKEAVV